MSPSDEGQRAQALHVARANRCAHALFARGVAPGDAVALDLADLGAHPEVEAGCRALLAVTVSLGDPAGEAALRIAREGAVALIHDRGAAARAAALRRVLPKLRVALAIDDGSGADLTQSGSEDFDSALAGASPRRDFPWATTIAADAAAHA